MRIGSLFSGSGMLDEGVRSVLGGEVAWHAEVDPAACKVLAHRYPGVPNLGDITAVDWSAVEPVDVITGGSPCQDVSSAGKRVGMRAGTRSGLWARMCDAIETIRPALVVWENVRGVLSAEADSALECCPGCVGDGDDGPVLRALGRVLGDLAELGYDTQWHGLRAADVGAPHGRFRVFVVAFDAAGVHAGHSHARGSAEASAVALSRSLYASGVATDAERVRRDGRSSDARRGPVGGVATAGSGALAATDAGSGPLARPATAGDGLRLAAERRDGSVADASRDGRDEGWPESAGIVGGSDAALGRDAATDTDCTSGEARSGRPGRGDVGRLQPVVSGHTDWGQYEPAIRRWEHVTGRPAPAPTEPGSRGGQRLSPRLTEWMMGWPAGWVTDVPGVSRNDALRICGNGVVPQQAAEALRRMLDQHASAAA